MMAKFRIILADDHPIVLSGLRNLIDAEIDLEVVGEASNGLTAFKLIRETKPDAAVIDITMPEMNGILLSRRLSEAAPSVRLLVLTLHEDRSFLKQAIDAGVRGYILKRSAAENLVAAIRAVISGGLYVDPAIASDLFDTRRSKRQDAGGTGRELTERETEVLKLVALGFTGKEIARRLDVGLKSIETYRLRGFEKLGFKTRVELVRYASNEGWLASL